jgi:hypothetical protein
MVKTYDTGGIREQFYPGMGAGSLVIQLGFIHILKRKFSYGTALALV